MNFNMPGVQPQSFQPQFGFPPHHSQNRGPPPMKKPRGNPIITRYPPPPGYKPTIQPPPSYQQPGWQQIPQSHGYPLPPQAGYQHPQYGQSIPYQGTQTQYAGYPPPQYPANGYPFPQNGYHSGGQPGWSGPVTSPQSAPAVSNHPFPNPFDQIPRRHSSAPYPHQTYGSEVVDGNDEPYPPQEAPASEEDDLEDDFDGESYFARHPDEINPDLSLGLIEWKAPLPTKRPLPATFAEAELEALAPRLSKPSDDESISEYYIDSRKEESLNNVRLSETWSEIKDNIIFRNFPRVCTEVLSMFELISMYRDRIDPAWEAGERMSPELSRDPTPAPESARGDSMDVDVDCLSVRQTRDKANSDCQMLDDLEHALGSRGEPDNSLDLQSHHSRSTSATSQNLPKFKRPKPLPPVRDRAQEDVLAALGVTGSPKMVYETPGPAFGPPPDSNPARNGSTEFGSSSSRHNSQGRINSISHSSNSQGRDVSNNSHYTHRPTSATSQHTGDASDFGDNSNNATPRPKIERRDSRKRGYTDSEDENSKDHIRQDDDETPKQRRKQARIGLSSR